MIGAKKGTDKGKRKTSAHSKASSQGRKSTNLDKGKKTDSKSEVGASEDSELNASDYVPVVREAIIGKGRHLLLVNLSHIMGIKDMSKGKKILKLRATVCQLL